MLEEVKKSLFIVTDAYDTVLTRLINAAIIDLNNGGIDAEVDSDDSMVIDAVVVYCQMRFGTPSTDSVQNFKLIYDDMKAKMKMSTRYHFGSDE